MTARTANDLGELQKGLKSLAERLGHPQCATGCDILHLETEREFIFGSKVEIDPQPLLNPQPLPPISDPMLLPQDAIPTRSVTVSIPGAVNSDINALTRAAGVVLGKLGCPSCCSGFDILFRRELDLLVLDDHLNVQGFGRFR